MAERLTLGAFLEKRASDRRVARLTHDIALPIGHGLEFGPANNPTPLPEGLKVEYVDYKRADAEGADGTAIDHVWTGAGSFAEVCDHRAFYDYAIAAQVAQYVPNLLGWFRGIFEVLRPGGVLNLSLPDRRFMFDIRRKTSTLGELIEAYYLDYDRPSLRQLFDHTLDASAVEPDRLWTEDLTPDSIPRFSGEVALDLAHAQAKEAVTSKGYMKCHCWVFTPFSFLDLVEGVTRLSLFPFVISQFAATESGDYEFFISLRRDAEEKPKTLKEKQLFAISYVRNIVEKQNRIARRLADR